MAGGRKELCNEEVHCLYVSQNVLRAIKSRSMRWVGHVESIGGIRNEYKILVEHLKGRDYSEDLCVDWMLIFEWILKK